jgi:hypothetical protein
MVAPDTSLSERLDRRERVAWMIEAVDELGSANQRALFGWASEDDWRRQMEIEGVARSTLRSRVRRALAWLRVRVRRPDGVRTDLEPSTT